MKKELRNLIQLRCNIKIYVPSTVDTSNKVDNSLQVNAALSFLSDRFGGATSYQALGCWKSPIEGLVKEPVTICESFTDSKNLEIHIQIVLEYCEKLKSEMRQEAISLEINNKLYFV
jgi:hypothetical protein